jgi:hypothetical protein
MSTSAEVQDFGFSDSTALYPHSPRANGSPVAGTTAFASDDDDDPGFFTTGLGDVPLDMFKVERAQLNLNITIHQLVVANNILVMASTDSKLYKIDLTLQEQIVGMSPVPSKCVLIEQNWNSRKSTAKTKRSKKSSWMSMPTISSPTQTPAKPFTLASAICEPVKAGPSLVSTTCTSNPLPGTPIPVPPQQGKSLSACRTAPSSKHTLKSRITSRTRATFDNCVTLALQYWDFMLSDAAGMQGTFSLQIGMD